jgi:hypothetical protein
VRLAARVSVTLVTRYDGKSIETIGESQWKMITPTDWGDASQSFDSIKEFIQDRTITDANEAQTRFDVIDRMIREVWGWPHGQVIVEEPSEGIRFGYVDYILRSGDQQIVVEAKRAGAAFPSPTRRKKLKLSGAVLGSGEVGAAITQAERYAQVKDADVVVVTNGLCWVFYSMRDRDSESSAGLLFPFDDSSNAEELFNQFSLPRVETGSLRALINRIPLVEKRLISAFDFADDRVDRNKLADYLSPALDHALYADALLSDPDALKHCFVATEARTKFDSVLGMHITDRKPEIIRPARRIRRDKPHGQLEQLVEDGVPSYAPPVTLLIGPVGAGKSTYLKHFELISGHTALSSKNVHWIYIDFEKMGPTGSPRDYLYASLRDYLLVEHPDNPTDYEHAVKPAYRKEVAALARGPYALISRDESEFNHVVGEHIRADYDKVEPYVDKLFQYISSTHLCIIVLDNADLSENTPLETAVFAEGLALSKRIFCQTIVSIRDSTYVRHRSDSTFDAFELRKIWLDPPPFKTVLSRRLSYCESILHDRPATLVYDNGMKVIVPDLGAFFHIVQSSILGDRVGDYISAMADTNIRRGLGMVVNFLTSGHIQADKAISVYLAGKTFIFPPHEILKGTILGQWRHFSEDKSEATNVFDARLGSQSLRLLRLFILQHLYLKAASDQTAEVRVSDCAELFSPHGASSLQLSECLRGLQAKGLIRNVSSMEIDSHSVIVLTRTGGYYLKFLCRTFFYVEECMFDTAIDNEECWLALHDLTTRIEAASSDLLRRMELRGERIVIFLDYLIGLEDKVARLINYVPLMPVIKESVLQDVATALRQTKRWRYSPVQSRDSELSLM